MIQDKKATWPGGFSAALAGEDQLRKEYEAYVAEQKLRQEYEAYVAAQSQPAPALAAEDRPGVLESAAYAAKSVGRGFVESGTSMLAGAGALGAGMTESARGLARQGVGDPIPPLFNASLGERVGGFMQGKQRMDAEYAPDRDERFRGSMLESVPEAFGSAGAFIVGGLATPAAPALGIGALGAASQFTSGYYDALAETQDLDKAFQAGLANAPAGLLEAIPLGGQVARFLGRANKATGGSLGRIMATAVVEGSENAAQELVQSGWQDAVAKYVMEYDTDREMLTDALRQEALPAFIVGAVLGGLSSVGQLPPDVAEKYGVEAQVNEAASAPPEVNVPVETLPSQPGQEPGQTAPPEAAPAVAPQEVATDKTADTGAPVQNLDATAPVGVGAQPAVVGVTQSNDPRFSPELQQPAAPPSAPQAPVEAGAPPSSPSQGAPTADTPSTPAPDATGIKNRTVEAELERIGRPIPPGEDPVSFKQRHAEAKDVLEADPMAGQKLVADLQATNRPPTDLEDAILTFEVNRLRVEREAAQDAFNAAPSPEAQKRIDAAIDAYAAAADVTKSAGTASSRSLSFRRMMLARDYSLAAIEARAIGANQGFPLSPEQTAEVAKLADEMKALQAKLAKVQEEADLRAATMEAEIAFLRMQKSAGKAVAKRGRAKRIAESKAKIDDLWKEWNSATRGQASMSLGGVDPKLVTIAFKLAVEYSKLGTLSFQQWSDAMVSKGGETIRPYLQPAWEQAQKSLREERAAALKQRAAEGRPLAKQRPMILRLAESFVEGGISDRDALTDAVHEVVKEAYPTVTRRQVMDAISGYGDFKPLTDDAVKRQLRDIRGQLQQVAKLEDLAAKLPPKKSGAERQAPSKEQRRLILKVNEARRRAGIKSSGPDTLKTVEDSMRARYQNQIDDLQYQIDNKTQIVRDRTKTEPSAEVMALREKRDALRREFEALFPKDIGPEMNPDVARVREQIAEVEKQLAAGGKVDPKRAKQGPPIEMVAQLQERLRGLKEELARVQKQAKPTKPDPAIAQLEEAIAELDRRIKEGGAPAQSRAERQGPPTEPVFKLRQQREALQKQLAEMRRKDPATIRLEAAQRAVEESIADYERRIAAGETAAKQRQPGPTNAELDALRARRDALRAELDEMRPRQTQDEKDLAAFKRRKLNEIARLKERAFYGEFEDPRPGPRVKKEIALDTEAIKVQAEEQALKRKIEAQIAKYEYENRSRAQIVRDKLSEAFHFQKSFWSAFDFSAVFRQGGFFTAAYPGRAATRWAPEMARSTFSEQRMQEIDAALRARPHAGLAARAGQELRELDGPISAKDERFRSKLAERIPGVRASNRAFNTYLNMQETEMFDAMVDGMPQTPTLEDAKVFAQIASIGTGKAYVESKWLKSLLVAAGNGLWSPSLHFSRLQLVAKPFMLAFDGSVSPQAKFAVAKMYARSLRGLAAVYISLQIAKEVFDIDDEDLDIEWDPRSSDFGKIRVGDRRYDPLGGLSQLTVVFTRIVGGEVKTLDGEVKPIRGPDRGFGSKLPTDYGFRFLRSKATPMLGELMNLADQQDFVGRKYDLGDFALGFVVPLSIRDVKNSLEEEGVPLSAANFVISLLGIGTSIYDTPEKRAEREANE